MHRALRNGFGGLAATLLLATGLAGTATAAHAQPTTVKPAAIKPAPFVAANGFISIINNRTNKCVDVPNSNHTNGSRLQQWECNGTDAQWWAPFDLGNGFFVLQSRNTASLCMNARPTWTVEQSACDPLSQSDQWQWGFANPIGDLVLKSALPGNRCLGLSPNSSANGTSLALIPCSNTNPANFWHPAR